MIPWCQILAWLQPAGLVVDGIGVVILTRDLFPDYNLWKSRQLMAVLSPQVSAAYQSGQDGLRTADDPPSGYSTAPVDQLATLAFVSAIKASAVPLDLEGWQRQLSRSIQALHPFNPFRWRKVPSDLAGFYEVYSSHSAELLNHEMFEGQAPRQPVYRAAVILILGFALQLLASLPPLTAPCL